MRYRWWALRRAAPLRSRVFWLVQHGSVQQRPSFSLCLLAACKTLASTMDAPHASFCAVWVGNWSPRIVLTYQLLSSLGSRERRRVAPTTAVATSAQSDLSKCFEETLGLARTLSEPLLRRPQNLRHKSKLVVVSR